jgi:hypothetical protein
MTTAQTQAFPFDFAPQATQDTDLLRQIGFLPGLKEILLIRQVHALEHATVWVLSEMAGGTRSNPNVGLAGLLGGMSTDQGFYLYGTVNTADLQRAVHTALQRMVQGDWDLAVHPNCGTNLSVGMMVTAGLALGSTLLFPKGPIAQLIGFGMAATVASQIAPDLGSLAQRFVTTSIPFNLAIDNITTSRDQWGRPTHFVRVHWKD